VVDAGLRDLLGPQIDLRFDLGGWYPAAFSGEKLTVYLTGRYAAASGRREAPLLVKFPYAKGTVIFTSFHNEAQASETEKKLLRYLVFSAVTAKIEASVSAAMLKGGFKPTKKNVLGASAGEAAPAQSYVCEKPGHLQFVLGFQDVGARLKLTVTGPGGEKFEREGTSTLTIDVPQAAAGEWKYSVSAIQVPNENFPVTITVGQK